ncbi:MAG: FHA domain-containing protein [Myxococcales bacterium]|nr:FHA domain-containing protein [Myxococcota bacterium]MDW8281695.1 FHA domain-containing protein [Myxococcales bacterium]
MPKVIYQDSSGSEREFVLGSDPVLIGRAAECAIQTQDGLVSRRHARIVVYDGIYWIEDLGSANGVYVNSQRIERSQLRPGDEVVCGSLTLRFVADTSAAVRRTEGMTALANSPLAPAAPAAALPRHGSSQELDLLQAELDRERRLRKEAELARDEAQRRVAELMAQLAAQGEAEELARLRRRNEQLESELRRVRGPHPGSEALRAVEAERDRLRARVAELEAQGGRAADEDTELARLRRRVEQLQSELRRTRGSPPQSGGSEAARVAELEEMVWRLQQERDEALRQAAGRQSPPQDNRQMAEELMRAQRQVEQLQSELRRLRSSGGAAPAHLSAELEAALRQLRDVERERDSLRMLVAHGQVGRPKPPARVLECLAAVRDGLADIRSALRAAGDDLALDQIEQIRSYIKEASELLEG